ncbi:hypothetical protein JL722_2966 [Aureococcus anophagefferens]|nr:hypothetical protein JL722_2966 [Aureococcus anophagefferens]
MVQCDPYAIKAIVEDSADKATFRPVLQALDVRNSAKEGTADRYRVLVSDTVHFLRCMAVAKLNALVTDGHLVKGCLVRLLDYRVTWIQNRAVIILLDLEVLSGAMERVGSPQNYPESLNSKSKAAAPPPPPAPAPAPAAEKRAPSGAYHDLAEDVVLGIARWALHPGREGAPSRGEPPTDVAGDVAALAAALAAEAADPRAASTTRRDVEARKLLSRVVDRHLAGAADEENPDQNDGPLPLSAFAALDALRHCCGGAKAGALEKLARLARRVHHHDFLLRPSALGLLASLAVRCAPRHGDALALKRAGEDAPPATQNLFDELRRCAQCVLSRLLAWPERMAKGGCDLGPDARPPAPTAGSSPDEMGGALAFYDAIACGEALRALKLLGRLGVVAATSDQADSLPLVALLGNRNGVAEGLAATDDPFLADHAHRASVGHAVAAALVAICAGESIDPEAVGDDDERSLWLDDVATHDGPRLLLELLLARDAKDGGDDAFELLRRLAQVHKHQAAVVERIVRRVGGGVFSAHAAGMALYQMMDGSSSKKGELAILTALEAIRERAKQCRHSGKDPARAYDKHQAAAPGRPAMARRARRRAGGAPAADAEAEADRAAAELLAEEQAAEDRKAAKSSKKKNKKKKGRAPPPPRPPRPSPRRRPGPAGGERRRRQRRRRRHAPQPLLLDDMADEPPPAPRRRRRGGRPARRRAPRRRGLGAYGPALAAHEVDVDALRLMAPGDFADVGVPRDAGEAILDALRADDAGGAPWAKGWY